MTSQVLNPTLGAGCPTSAIPSVPRASVDRGNNTRLRNMNMSVTVRSAATMHRIRSRSHSPSSGVKSIGPLHLDPFLTPRLPQSHRSILNPNFRRLQRQRCIGPNPLRIRRITFLNHQPQLLAHMHMTQHTRALRICRLG